jgi:hypothetical protein
MWWGGAFVIDLGPWDNGPAKAQRKTLLQDSDETGCKAGSHATTT